MSTRYSVLDSPIGPLMLTSDGAALTGVHMEPHPEPGDDWVHDDAALAAARTQLAEYFDGRRTHFDLPLAARGTAFQQRVWAELARIPYAETASYADIATRIGQPTAVRAVGAANGRNPIAIVVPCHRVIGANGSLVGYGGGLDRKRTLLDLEGRARASRPA